MKVWVIITGICYESNECVHGVYSSQEKAEEELNKIEVDSTEFKYVVERKIE